MISGSKSSSRRKYRPASSPGSPCVSVLASDPLVFARAPRVFERSGSGMAGDAVIARRLRRRRPRPSDRWYLDEMLVRIGGERMYLWRALDHEGEVLDMLVQRRRDKRAALRLMRKLLKKQGFAPKLLVTDKLRSYDSAFRRLRLTCTHERGLRETIGPKTRIRWCDDESVSCNASSPLDQPSATSACTPPSTIPPIFNVASSPDPHYGNSEPKLSPTGKVLSPRHDAKLALAGNAYSCRCRDNAGTA